MLRISAQNLQLHINLNSKNLYTPTTCEGVVHKIIKTMKKQAFLLITIGAYLLASCANNTHQHDHDHGHDHNHETHAHASHDHGHEGHDHHDHDHGHNHNQPAIAHNHEHEDGISLKPGEAEAIGLTTETVAPGTFSSVIKCTGSIVGATGDVVTVVAPQSGTVHYVNSWAEGAAVSANANLFTISSRNVGSGDAAERARVTYETAKAAYERAEKLVGDKIISDREYEAAREAYEQARLAYEAVGSGNAAGSAARTSKSGYITRLWVNEGDYVEAGAPLATVAQNKRMQLRADVPQRYYNELPAIASANFVTPYDNTVYKLSDMNGQLLSYGRYAGETSYFIPVTFNFDNRAAIVPGSSVDVYLLGKTRNNVISLPMESITEEQGLFFVYRRLCENDFEKVEVKTGLSDGSRIEILSGVNAGDKIVVNGVYRVKLAANSNVLPDAHNHNH